MRTRQFKLKQLDSVTMTLPMLQSRIRGNASGFSRKLANLLQLSILVNYNLPALPRYNSCVVVGNGPASTALGAAIDRHDAVIRINDAPTKGYEREKGNKTTHRVLLNDFFTPEHLRAASNPYGPDEQLLFVVHNEIHLHWLYLLLHDNMHPTLKVQQHINGGRDLQFDTDAFLDHMLNPAHSVLANQSVRLVDYNVMTALHTILDLPAPHYSRTGTLDQSPSTGIVAVFVAIQVCNSVSVTGFTTTLKRGGSYHRYFEQGLHGDQCLSDNFQANQTVDTGKLHAQHHRVANEYELLKALLKQGRVTILKP